MQNTSLGCEIPSSSSWDEAETRHGNIGPSGELDTPYNKGLIPCSWHLDLNGINVRQGHPDYMKTVGFIYSAITSKSDL